MGTSALYKAAMADALCRIVAALSAVPHDFRDVVLLVDLADFTYSDAAQILDIPIGTVMSRLHRGRRMLKGSLATSAAQQS